MTPVKTTLRAMNAVGDYTYKTFRKVMLYVVVTAAIVALLVVAAVEFAIHTIG